MPSDQRRVPPGPVQRYASAIVFTAAAVFMRLGWLAFSTKSPYLPFTVSVIFTTWYGGLGPGLLSILLGLVSALRLLHGEPANRPGGYVFLALIIVWVIEAQGRVRRRLAAEIEERELAEAKEERQRQWSETTLASIGDAVMTTDAQGRVNFMNPVAESLTGWSLSEAAGQPLENIFRIQNEETAAPVENPVDRVLKEGVIVGLANHTALRTKDGRLVPIDDSGAPVRAANGKILGAVLVFRDVTERRRVVRQIRDSQQRLELAMDAGRMGAWELDLRSGRVTWSASLERIHGIEAGTFGGTLDDVLAFVHAEDRESMRNSVSRAFEAPGDYFLVFRVVRPDGTVAWLEKRGRLLRDDHGVPERLAGIAMDITSRMLAEAELRRTKDRVSGILDSITDGFMALDREGRFTYVNELICRAARKSREDLLGKVAWDVFPDAVKTEFYPQFQRVMSERVPAKFEVHYGPRGLWLEVHAQPTEEGLSAYVLLIGERKRAEAEVRRRLAQQNAVARLGAAALTARDRDELLRTTLSTVANALGVEFASALEALPDGGGLIVRAGFGWPMPREGELAEPGHGSQAGYTILSGEPVVVDDLSGDTPFQTSRRLAEIGVSSGITVAIPGEGKPFGVLAAFSARPRAFTSDDTQFMLAVANIVTNSIRRQRETEARERLAEILESTEDAVVGKNLDGIVESWNRAAERVYGYAAAEILGKPISLLIPPERGAEEAGILERLRRGEHVQSFETVRVRKDGVHIPVSLTISPIRDRSGRVIGASHIARDITERKQVEEKLQQTQKLESLGILAGGIAHDFNNLLTGILGNASLINDVLPPYAPARGLAESVIQAAERAAHLTRQMLAYSGRGRFLIEPMNCSQQVREITALIGASIPKNVQVRLALADDLPLIDADTGQFQQLLMNLVINGAEAVGSVPGSVTIVTGVEEIGPSEIARMTFAADLRPGRYISLEVRDTGCGMDPATLARIFDPFFTTKFTGRGLGLAAVLGIVRGHQGGVHVRSEPGRGTTFQVLFPPAAQQQPQARPVLREPQAGADTVVVVDDEDIVRRAAKVSLEKYGYRVVLAENGQHAIETFRRLASEVSVILLDMTMPVMSGEETFQELRKIRPDVPVIATSGYSEAEAMERFGKGLAGFIQKPYSAAQLASKVAEVVQGKKTAGASF